MSGSPATVAVRSPFAVAGSASYVRQSSLGQRFNVRDYGALGLGGLSSSIDTAAFLAAKAAAEAASGNRGILYMPAGEYSLLDRILFDGSQNIAIVGDGQQQTKLNHIIPSGDSPFGISPAAGQTTSNGLRLSGFRIDGTSGVPKVGISLDGMSNGVVDDVTVYLQGHANDIALQLKGWDQSLIHGCHLEASTPLSLELASTAGLTGPIDHMQFVDLTLTSPSNTKPLVYVAPSVSLTNSVFGGKQTWLGGGYGFLYDNSGGTNLAAFTNNTFANIRWEPNGTQTAAVPWGNFFLIKATAYPSGAVFNGRIAFKNCYTGSDGAQGWLLRNLYGVIFERCIMLGAITIARTEIDIDSTNDFLTFVDSSFTSDPLATHSISPLLEASILQVKTTAAVGGIKTYGFAQFAKRLANGSLEVGAFGGVPKWGRVFVVAAGAAVNLPSSATVGPSNVTVTSEDSVTMAGVIEHGRFVVSSFSAAPTLVTGSPNAAAGNVAGKLCLDGGAAGMTLRNNLPYTVRVTVTMN